MRAIFQIKKMRDRNDLQTNCTNHFIGLLLLLYELGLQYDSYFYLIR